MLALRVEPRNDGNRPIAISRKIYQVRFPKPNLRPILGNARGSLFQKGSMLLLSCI
jgi:hypothetical protein